MRLEPTTSTLRVRRATHCAWLTIYMYINNSFGMIFYRPINITKIGLGNNVL